MVVSPTIKKDPLKGLLIFAEGLDINRTSLALSCSFAINGIACKAQRLRHSSLCSLALSCSFAINGIACRRLNASVIPASAHSRRTLSKTSFCGFSSCHKKRPPKKGLFNICRRPDSNRHAG